MFAKSACAVQMLLVAFSLLMCCSRVCNAILKHLFPFASTLTPMILPGRFLLNASFVAKNAACGPPKPMGTPNRCEFPMAISAPNSPGGVNKHNASKSVAMITCAS